VDRARLLRAGHGMALYSPFGCAGLTRAGWPTALLPPLVASSIALSAAHRHDSARP